MIKQIAPVSTKTAPLPKINRGNIQARDIEILAIETTATSLPNQVEIWSPMMSGPYIVPVTRWIE